MADAVVEAVGMDTSRTTVVATVGMQQTMVVIRPMEVAMLLPMAGEGAVLVELRRTTVQSVTAMAEALVAVVPAHVASVDVAARDAVATAEAIVVRTTVLRAVNRLPTRT